MLKQNQNCTTMGINYLEVIKLLKKHPHVILMCPLKAVC